MATRGGKRNGAGNKEGSIRPKFNLYWSEKEIEEYMQWIKENYQKSDKLATWVGDHLFGKAVQPIGGDPENPITLQFDNAFAPKTKRGSSK